MFNIGGGEMVMLAILALLVFGPESLPDLAKTVARTVRAFRQASMDLQAEVREALELETKQRNQVKEPTVVKPDPWTGEDEVFETASPKSAQLPPHSSPSQLTESESAADTSESLLEAAGEPETESEVEAPATVETLAGLRAKRAALAQTETVARESLEPAAESAGETLAAEAQLDLDDDDDDGPGLPMTKPTAPSAQSSEEESEALPETLNPVETAS